MWSLAHVLEGLVFSLFLPWWAVWLLLAIWEPLETLWVYKLAARWFNLRFGFEGPLNVVGDILCNTLGIALAYFLILPYWDPVGLR